MKTPNDLIKIRDAKSILGISQTTMANIIKRGELRVYPNKLDRREKLVSKAEVEALKPKLLEI